MNEQMVNVNYDNYQKKTNNKSVLYIIIIVLLLFIIGAAILLLNTNTKKEYSRTIMIYMVGSDLESKHGSATASIDGIKYEKIKDKNINVLMIAGGSSYWHNDYIDKEETSIYKLTENGFVKDKTQDILNMGDPDTLTDFINYVYENYKSDKYELIFWDHGGAIDGSEYDELSYNRDSLAYQDNLSLQELNSALSKTEFNKNNKLELIFFSTCLNGSLEVANTFKDYTDYVVASEEVTLGNPYSSELRFINNIEKSDNAVEIGKKYISSYKDVISLIKAINVSDEAIYSTYSIVKTASLEKLNDALSDFFEDIEVADNFSKISKTRANLFQYGSQTDIYDMVDLYNLIDELSELDSKKAEKLKKELENTIVYNWATDSQSRGLSIYFPYKGSKSIKQYFMKIYNNIDGLTNYRNFIQTFNNMKMSGNTKKTVEFNRELNVSNSSTQEADFTLELTNEQLENYASAQYVVYRDNKDGYYRPIYVGKNVTVDGNKLKTSIRNKQLKVVSKTNPNESMILTLFETDDNDKFTKYNVSVILEDFRKDPWVFDHADINILYNKENKDIQIINVMYTNDTFASSLAANIDDYEAIAFSLSSGWSILDENGKIVGDGVVSGFETEPNDFQFELEQFDDNYDYYCVFIITDIYGNKSSTKLVKMK